ncbi:DUF4263 domain-containing protein [Phormidium yuhuli AB48]|uniref:DUF4263 domain-containing protein n=1 Tax=Phormidium yuhuli AB48 TaxID=2940671 RepID=A0ABY5AR00_9CYAN|nr:Shedu anti-phage system protein SduA domain-containing protein [Phormidium yuhuli]USR90776.1 DUF4263 domain-containing protein [Phormidium yuhuli AB48]
MKSFENLSFNPILCRRELNELKSHLDRNSELKERRNVLPFFRERKHLSAFIGSYFPYINSFDKIAYEYDIFGDFKADLVVGDSNSGWYGFIEFESAKRNSIFRSKTSKATPDWSTDFEHGFSQVLDWFWKLSSQEDKREFSYHFGPDFAGYEGMLIIGRSQDLQPREQDRLRWRRDRLMVNSKRIYSVTFDELYSTLDTRLKLIESYHVVNPDESL